MNLIEKYRFTQAKQLGLPLQQNFVFLRLFKKWIWITIIVASILQCILFFSLENAFAILCVVFSWALTDKIILNKINLTRYTFSTLVLLGYSLTQYYLPLVFTLLEGKPLIFNLKFPYNVFIHSILALITFLFAHHIYKKWQQGSGGKLYYKINSFLKKNYFFTPPSDSQIWIIGFFGLAGMMATYIGVNHYDSNEADRSTLSKVLQGLMPYVYAPFFILLKPLFTPGKIQISNKIVIQILAFTIVLLLLSMAGNSRGLFMVGITSVGIAYLVGLLIGKFDYKILKFKNVILAFLGLWIITGPLSNLGTAMVMVRTERSQISSMELILKTLEVSQDKKAIYQYKAANLATADDWDERYFDNIFLSRFCNLKFNDISLELAYKLGYANDAMLKFSTDRLWAVLPMPVLNFFHINVDKITVNAASYGDYFYYLTSGNVELGGFKTGHFAGIGLATFGWWYLLVLAVGMIPLFFLLDLYVLYYKKDSDVYNYLSIAGLIDITFFFTFFSVSNFSETIVNIYSFLIRGWIQMVLLYWVIIFVSYKLSLVKKIL